MRQFLTRFGLFALGVVLLVTLGEIAIRLAPNQYKVKDSYAACHSDRVATLILGSSLGYYGIDPSLLGDEAFNFANISQTLDIDYEILKDYFADSRSLRRVILPIGYATLVEPPLAEGIESFRVINYQLYTRYDRHRLNPAFNFEIAHPFGYAQRLVGALTHRPLSCDSLGMGLDYTYADRQTDMALRAAEAVAFNTYPLDWVDRNAASLDSIARFCAHRGIDLIIARAPVTADYYRLADKRQIAVADSVIADLAGRYEFTYVDLLTDRRFTPDDFHDNNHLNIDRGAPLFTSIIADCYATKKID